MQTYPHFSNRTTIDLNGLWEFLWQGESVSWETASVPPSGEKLPQRITVPGIFDNLPALEGKRGLGWYRRTIRFDSLPQRLALHMGGLGLRARVFWDGREIGRSELPYSPLHLEFEPGPGLIHEISLAIDNRFPRSTAGLFHPDFDFYGYGGIYRPAWLWVIPECSLRHVRVCTIDLEQSLIRLEAEVSGACPAELEVSFVFDDHPAQQCRISMKNGRGVWQSQVPNGQAWSPDTPHLHTVRVQIGKDHIVERFGLRTIEAREGKILLNGKSLWLRGVNRHDADPRLGPALPAALMLNDLQRMKDLGVNFVRGAHYPQSQEFLDACDELGILVWEEALGWNDPVNRMTDPAFADLQESQVRTMIRESFNHPSIIFWAFLNEGRSDAGECRALYSRLAGAVREEDSSRLISYASNRITADACLDLVDVISMNLYPAWIDTPDWGNPQPLERIAKAIEQLAAWCSEPARAQQPLILSEIGCGAIYGWHDPHQAGWTEEFQAAYFTEAIRAVSAHPRLSGLTLWQLYDTRSYSAGAMRPKARGFNNAGILDEYRRPKLAAEAVRKAFLAIANCRQD